MEEENNTDPAQVARRRLLRGAGVVAAGVVGAGVVVAAGASPASAAAGDPINAGQSNDAGSATTSLTSDSANGTLKVGNSYTSVDTEPDPDITYGAPQLVLAPQAGTQTITTSSAGALGYTADGTFWVSHEAGIADYLYTTATATQVVPIQPQRVIDTRYANQRTRILNPGNLDGAGRVKGGKTIEIDLSDFVNYGMTVFANMVVVSPTAPGYLALFPAGHTYHGGEPSSLDYAAGQTLANFAVTGISVTDTTSDAVGLYVHTTAHVILDILAFGVFFPGQINPAIMPGSAGAGVAGLRAQTHADRARLAHTSTPSWATKK